MKNIYQIIKVDFLTTINSLSKNKKSAVLLFTLLSIVGGVIFYLLVKFAIFLFGSTDLDISVPFLGELPLLIITFILSFAFILLLLESLSIILGKLYLSSDTQLLLSLPIKTNNIFLGRLISTILKEDIFLYILVYPFFVGYGISNSLNILFYIESFLFILFFPVLPLCIAVFILLPLTKLISPSKLKTVIYVVQIIFAFGIYIMSQIFNPAYDIVKIEDFSTIFEKGFSFVRFLPGNVGIYILSAFRSNQIITASLIFIIYIFINVFLLSIATFFSNIFYGESLSKLSIAQTSKVYLPKGEETSNTLNFLPKKIRGMVSKDFKMLLRDSKINLSLIISIAYLIFFMFFFVRVLGRQMPDENIPVFGLHFNFRDFIYPFIFLLSTFTVSSIGSYIFYGEAKNVWIPFTSKLSFKEFLYSKLITSIILTELVNVILFLILVFMFRPSASTLIFISLIAFIVPILFVTVNICVPAMFPVFKEADNPKKLIPFKVSIITIISFSAFFCGLIGLLFLNIFLSNFLSLTLSTTIIAFLIVLITAVICFPLLLAAERSLENFQIE
ncbi:MAG TPA: hypothetical protein PLL52_04765 [Caldisericia bacterium]|nr:hypothetical protein [Caldisericia bacterium]